MADRHPDDDELVELALSDLDERQRDELASHLARCEPCRTRYGAIADSVDHALAAAPRVAPPAGFSQSVLAAMGLADPEGAGRPGAGGEPAQDAAPASLASWRAAGPRGSRAGARRRVGPGSPRAWLVAIAAALALLLAGSGAALLLHAWQASSPETAAAGPALTTRDGSRVGTVLEGSYGGQPVLVVTLTDAPAGIRYECQLLLADGTRQPAGSWVVTHPAGTTWVIPRPEGEVAGLELVTGAGEPWARAEL